MSNKIIAVVELDTSDLDEAEKFMQLLFQAGADYGYINDDINFYLMEGTESTGSSCIE